MDDGSRVRFGDFDIVISVTPDSLFKREGADIITEYDISFPQAALGDIVTVKTVDDEVKLRIPQGTQPDTVIRLKGKGLERLRSNGKGDHYVRIKIVVPKNVSAKQKELLEEFEEERKKKRGWF